MVPYTSPWVGGVDHGNCPEHARIARGADFIDRFPAEAKHQQAGFEAGTFLYGGPLKVHFGHVISDSVPRLYAFDPDRHQGVVFAPIGGGCQTLPQWLHDVFALFGMHPGHVIQAAQPTVFETMEFAPPGTVVRNGPHPWYLQRLARLDTQIDRTGPDRVFLGRGHIIGQGGVMGESYFSELLGRNGFANLQPERHSIHSQMSLFAGARQIVFTEGSSILSTDLLPSLDAEAFMLPRRNGGEALFGPQLEARARRFQLLGGPDGVLRLDNHRGMPKPDSPSYLLRPEAVHADMVRAGLVDGAFDMDHFIACERRDALTYWRGNAAAAEAQLAAAGDARRQPPC